LQSLLLLLVTSPAAVAGTGPTAVTRTGPAAVAGATAIFFFFPQD